MPARQMTPFQIFAEPVRFYLAELLCCGATTSGDLAVMAHDRFGVSWGSVSRHLATMRASGIVRQIRVEQQRWYRLDDEWLDRIDAAIEPLREAWRAGEADRLLGDTARYEQVVNPIESEQQTVVARRGMRGRTTFFQADRGVGRSEDAWDADGGSDFD